MILPAILFVLLAALGGCTDRDAPGAAESQAEVFDVVVYGGTPPKAKQKCLT